MEFYGKANTAKEESKKAEYKEVLELIGTELRPEKVLENLNTEEFMNRYQAGIEKKTERSEALEGAIVDRRNSTAIRVITKEGFVYLITESEVSYQGKQGENPPPDLQETDIEIEATPEGYTNTDVIAKIKAKIELGENQIEYSLDGTTWKEYTKEEIVFKENGVIYARLINELGETGECITKNVTTIDKEDPNEAIVSFSPISVTTKETITATVEQSDKGVSGVDIKNCKWIYKTREGVIGGQGTFTKEKEELTLKGTAPGSYYLYIETVDKAKNKKETEKGPVTVRDGEAPNVTIEINNKTNYINGKVAAKVTIKDEESGVDLGRCKWIVNQSATPLGTDTNYYTGGTFTSETQEVSSAKISVAGGNYYIHVLATDKAGNTKESVSNVITIKSGYAISTPQDLQNMGNNLAGYYYVINDINMSGFNFARINGNFSGNLDGQGFTIWNLTIEDFRDHISSDYTAIFTGVKGNAQFSNLLLKNVTINAPNATRCAVIASRVNSENTNPNIRFSKVGIEGRIIHNSISASFVGQAFLSSGQYLTFSDCYAKVDLIGNRDRMSSGFVNYSVLGTSSTGISINKSFWAGTNSMEHCVSSFASNADNSNYDNQYTVGNISVQNSYYDKQKFSTSIAPSISGTGLTTQQMKTQSSYTGWDFNNTWYMGSDGYPELKFE